MYVNIYLLDSKQSMEGVPNGTFTCSRDVFIKFKKNFGKGFRYVFPEYTEDDILIIFSDENGDRTYFIVDKISFLNWFETHNTSFQPFTPTDFFNLSPTSENLFDFSTSVKDETGTVKKKTGTFPEHHYADFAKDNKHIFCTKEDAIYTLTITSTDSNDIFTVYTNTAIGTLFP